MRAYIPFIVTHISLTVELIIWIFIKPQFSSKFLAILPNDSFKFYNNFFQLLIVIKDKGRARCSQAYLRFGSNFAGF
jgi:hypothetical protein